MVQDVPAMPMVAQKVMHMLGDPRTTNSMLADTLSADQALVSRILQMANSPFFGTRQRVSSISGAIFILGHAALRSLVITVCTRGLFKHAALMEEKLWEHSLGAASAAKEIAEKSGLLSPNEAFVSGLLHDIGKTSLAVVYREDFRNLFVRGYNDGLSMEEIMELEVREFGYDHCTIGARVLAKWRFPALFVRAARRHHVTDLDLIRSEESPEGLAIVGLANLISSRIGLGRAEPDKRLDVINSIYNDLLKLDRPRILSIVENTVRSYKEAREHFGLMV